MRKNSIIVRLHTITVVVCFFLSLSGVAQTQTASYRSPNDFWKKVQFGGTIGLSFGGDYTEVTLAPAAIYNVNEFFALGAGLQASYVYYEDYYTSSIYGVSAIGLFNPIPQIQFSTEIIQAYVSNKYDSYGIIPGYKDEFWNTAVLVGAGYRTGNVTIGVTYNLTYDSDKDIYGDAVMPFVRAYF